MRRLIATITLVATLSAPLAAQASPWGWVKHHTTSLAEGSIGAVGIVAGLTGYVYAASAVLGATVAADTTLALATFAIVGGIGAPLVFFGLAALGGYEIYRAVEDGSKPGSNVRRTEDTRGFLPVARGPVTQNVGMHH